MKIRVGVLAAFALAAVVLYQCLPRAKPRPPETLAALAPELSVFFPPSTRLMAVRRLNGMDDWIGVKVEMSRSDWPAFLSSTSLDSAALTRDGAHLFGPDQGVWDPNRHSELRGGQVVLSGQFRALNVGVADLGEDRVLVYIVNHGS